MIPYRTIEQARALHRPGVDDEWRNAWECPECGHGNPEYASACPHPRPDDVTWDSLPPAVRERLDPTGD